MVIKCIVFLKENTLNQCLGKAFSLIKWNALIIHLMYVIINLIALTLSEKKHWISFTKQESPEWESRESER